VQIQTVTSRSIPISKYRFSFRNHVDKYFYALVDCGFLKDSSITCIGERFTTEFQQARLPFFSFTYYGKNEVFVRLVAAANVCFKINILDHKRKPKTQW